MGAVKLGVRQWGKQHEMAYYEGTRQYEGMRCSGGTKQGEVIRLNKFANIEDRGGGCDMNGCDRWSTSH